MTKTLRIRNDKSEVYFFEPRAKEKVAKFNKRNKDFKGEVNEVEFTDDCEIPEEGRVYSVQRPPLAALEGVEEAIESGKVVSQEEAKVSFTNEEE